MSESLTDENRLDWIIENCVTVGGGDGFELRVFVPFDSECLRHAIDEVITRSATTPTVYPQPITARHR